MPQRPEALGVTRERALATRLCERLQAEWDPMFSKTIDPARPDRMDAILQALSARSFAAFGVLELGSGPGTLAARMLYRFPRCRIVAMDTDPLLLHVAATALRRFRSRTTWLLADLREVGWSSGLPARRFDAVVSSLALHWLEKPELRNVYVHVRRLLRPGGVLVNADYLPSRRLRIGRIRGRGAREVRKRSSRLGRSLRTFKLGWAEWWEALQREPSMEPFLRLRELRIPGGYPPRRSRGPRAPVSLEYNEASLRQAGFREVNVIWRDHEFRALVAIR